MQISDLPYEDQLKLARIAGACLALKDRLENLNFKVVKFQIRVSFDMWVKVESKTFGIETETLVDLALPLGTVQVAALVQ